ATLGGIAAHDDRLAGQRWVADLLDRRVERVQVAVHDRHLAGSIGADILWPVQREVWRILPLAWQAVLRSLPLAALPAVAFALVTILDRLPSIGRWNDAVSMVAQGPEEPSLTIAGFFTDWLFSAQL